jgi:hypothetical protein
MAALIADLWTIAYVFLIVGWQISLFLKRGSWPALSVKSTLNMLGYYHHVIFGTAQIRGDEGSHLSNAVDALLQVPVIVPLLLAAALLTAFYKWLNDIERRYWKLK